MQYKRDLEKIRRWCIRRKLEGEGWKVTDICKHVHISRMSFYRYWNRYKKEGLNGLKDHSKRPHTIHRIDKKIEQKVIQLRNKYQYCPHKIQGTLANHYKIKVGHMTVYRILCKRGLNNHPISKPRKKRKYIRFERKFPNELWQIDLKVIESEGIWLISIFDDHSRFVLSSIKCMEGTSNKIIYLLKRTIRKYGKPLQILTDHGSVLQFTF
jgi:transposase